MAQNAITDKCDLCKKKNNVEFFCKDCDEILCSSCKVSHAESKSSKNHEIIQLSEAINEGIVHKSVAVYCSQHSTVEVTLFCLKCEQLICTQCLAGKHTSHEVTIPDVIKDSKSDELGKNILALKEKKALNENALQCEGQIHSKFTKSIEQARKDISDQRAKVIHELDIVCNEQNTELTKLQENENKRYADACNEIKAQNQAITFALQTAENSIASKNTTSIVQATADTANTLHGIEIPTIPPTITAIYQPGDRSHPTICCIQGKVNINRTDTYQPGDRNQTTATQVQDKLHQAKGAKPKESNRTTAPQVQDKVHQEKGAKPKEKNCTTTTQVQDKGHHEKGGKPKKKNRTSTPQVQDKVHQEKVGKPKEMTNVHKVIPQEQKTSGDNKEHYNDNKPTIDINKVQLKSKVKVQDKSNFINTIVPLQNNEAWVQFGYDHHLTQIDSTGRIINNSVSLQSHIEDAKLCRNGLLATCQCGIYNLSVDGRSKSTFADLSPYSTMGLCVTQDMNVMVCLYTSTDSKVVRLNKSGHIIQTLQHGITGAPLYKQPWRVTLLTTGEVIVRDGNKIVGVNREGAHLFTREGEIQGRKLDGHSVYSITHDSNNNLFVTDWYNRVLVLEKDGTGAMCLLDIKRGIDSPRGIAVDNTGQLWIGCRDGCIHIIEY